MIDSSHQQKMIATILVILSGTFTTVNSIISACGNSSNCQCTLTSLENIKVAHNENKGIKVIVNVNSWDNVKVTCKGTKKLEDFNYCSKQYRKIINSLSIRSCVLSDRISLAKFVRKFGIVEPKIFIFQSFEKNSTLLTKKHLKGISKVKELILSYNSLIDFASDLFEDLPELERIDLSHNKLELIRDIFNATRNITYINLNKNNIYSMSSTLFYKLEELEHLDLGENIIGHFPESIFHSLVSLKSVNLRVNKLEELHEDLFRDSKKLETVDLSYNYFFFLPQNLFASNKDLRSISFHNNKSQYLVTLPDYIFANLGKLEEIYLNNNGFKYLPENLFSGSSSLKNIYLGNNNMTYLKQNMFKGLKNLEVLKINNNLIETINKRMFIDLEKLKIIDLSMNNISNITDGTFEGLTSLTELNMENNRLKFIEQEALFPLKNLSIAKFSNNQLHFGKGRKEMSPFLNSHFLRELHLSNNSIRHFYSDWLIGFNLTYLNLSHNVISTVSANTFYFPSNKTLVDLRYNNINYISMNSIEDSAIYHTKKRDVVILIDHNPMFCDCHMYDLVRYYRDEMPEYVKNYVEINPGELVCIQPAGTIGPKVKEFNTTNYICTEFEYFGQGSSCPYGCICTVRPKDKTRILDCSNLNMSEFVIDEKRFQFVNNYSLILNLTGNALTRIPSIETLESYNVTNLLLSNNFISKITVDQLPKNLTVLQLHNNDMESIDSDVIKHFNSSFFTDLTLSGNPIICDCDVEDLFFFVKLKGFSFKDLRKLKCKNMNIPMYYISFDNICSPVLGLKEEEVLNEGETSVQSEI